MSLPLAEQIMKDAGCNQWFVQFYDHTPTYDAACLHRHMDFFAANQLIYQEVRSIFDTQLIGGLYHVRFAGHSDPRLADYSEQFENQEGISLDATSYQMFEWSYQGWVNQDGLSHLEEHLANLNTLAVDPAAVGPMGPSG